HMDQIDRRRFLSLGLKASLLVGFLGLPRRKAGAQLQSSAPVVLEAIRRSIPVASGLDQSEASLLLDELLRPLTSSQDYPLDIWSALFPSARTGKWLPSSSRTSPWEPSSSRPMLAGKPRRRVLFKPKAFLRPDTQPILRCCRAPCCTWPISGACRSAPRMMERLNSGKRERSFSRRTRSP